MIKHIKDENSALGRILLMGQLLKVGRPKIQMLQ
jgi:hypothetical protein